MFAPSFCWHNTMDCTQAVILKNQVPETTNTSPLIPSPTLSYRYIQTVLWMQIKRLKSIPSKKSPGPEVPPTLTPWHLPYSHHSAAPSQLLSCGVVGVRRLKPSLYVIRLRHYGDPSSLHSWDVGYAMQFTARSILYVDY